MCEAARSKNGCLCEGTDRYVKLITVGRFRLLAYGLSVPDCRDTLLLRHRGISSKVSTSSPFLEE